MKQFKVFEGTTNQIDTRDRLKSIRIQADKRSTFIYQREIKKFEKKGKREIKKKTNIQPYKNGQTDGRTDRQSYLCSW